MATRILLVEDDKSVRAALCEYIEKQLGIDVVGQAEDGEAAVRLARELSPDVVTMDISMPGMNGIEATRQITTESPGIKVLGLSMHAHERFVREMLKAGASGYVMKDRAYDELADAIRALIAGEIYLSSPIKDCDAGAETVKSIG